MQGLSSGSSSQAQTGTESKSEAGDSSSGGLQGHQGGDAFATPRSPARSNDQREHYSKHARTGPHSALTVASPGAAAGSRGGTTIGDAGSTVSSTPSAAASVPAPIKQSNEDYQQDEDFIRPRQSGMARASTPLRERVDAIEQHRGQVLCPNGQWRLQRTLKPGSKWRRVQRLVKVVATLRGFKEDAVDWGLDPVDGIMAIEDAEEHLLRTRLRGTLNWWILLPWHPFRQFWEPFLMLPLLYVALFTPYLILLQVEQTPLWDGIEIGIWAFFLVDIAVNFLSAYLDEEKDQIVVEPRAIAWNYMMGWFVIDLVASIPIDWIMGDQDDRTSNINDLGRLAKLPRAIRLLRLLRLLRILRVARLGKHLSNIGQAADAHPAIGRITGTFFWAVLFLHWMAGLFAFVGQLEFESGNPSWLSEIDNGIENEPSQVRYLWAMCESEGTTPE